MREPFDEKLIRSATTFLTRWKGSAVQVRELRVSLRRLQIVVFQDWETMARQNLCISVGPLWMSGPFDWTGSDLRVELVDPSLSPAKGGATPERLFRLHDPVGFELFTDWLEIAEHVKLR